MKELSYKLTLLVERFERNYKDTLDDAEIDEKNYNVLYSLGADIKHFFDDVIEIINES